MEVAPSSSQYHRLPGRSSHLLLPWPGILSKQTEGKGNLASNNNKLVQKYSLEYFLGPRGPLVPPLVDPSDRQSARKIWIYTGLYAYESSQDPSNESDGPVGSPRCPPWPPWTPGPPHWPPQKGLLASLNSSSVGLHWTLKITSTALQIIKCCCWSYGTSYPSPSTP